jgi:hypothetical protein
MAMQPVDHLVAAVLAKDETRIQTVLGQDPDLAVARDMFGVSAVHAAHYTGATRLLSLLLPSEVDVFLAAELGAVDDVRRAVRAEPAGGVPVRRTRRHRAPRCLLLGPAGRGRGAARRRCRPERADP